MSLLLLTVTALLPFSQALDFFVSPEGSDSNTGTDAASPFLTLSSAQSAVRASAGSAQAEDITVHIADGEYTLDSPLVFTAADSGNNGYTISWTASGDNAVISGGTKLEGWTPSNSSTSGIYTAKVPVGTQSRNLYVGRFAAQFARSRITRSDFTFDNFTMKWTDTANDWLASIPGIENAEIRAIGSFTDRYSPIKSASASELVMDQPAWINQVWGWDTIPSPFVDGGLYVQNALSLLDEEGEWFLDSQAGIVYYKPFAGEDLSTVSTYLGRLETLLVVGGTYDEPVHDMSFNGLNLMHTTWNQPTTEGYVDQQTGGYMGDFNRTYPIFEATRPHWYQMPSAIQISAAQNIAFTGGSYTQLGSGGFGVGNDANAYITKVGLGTQNISIEDGYFTQVMGNSITLGGIQADAHHPSDERMINSNLTVSGNIFYNTSALYTSTVPIFATYVQYSTIAHNDMSHLPYSGICHGYGWGINDVGGSPRYQERGLYDYQPLYDTPTTSLSNIVTANLIHDFGLAQTDLGGIYTLSKSPSTVISHNYDYDSEYYGIYTDEGSNSLLIEGNLFLVGTTQWYHPNEDPALTTGNNSLIDNFGGPVGGDFDGFPDGTGALNDTFLRNFMIGTDPANATVAGQRTAYRAGVLPGRRAGRAVSNNASLANAHIEGVVADMVLSVNVSNFQDADIVGLSVSASVDAAPGYSLTPVLVPTAVPADSFALATYNLTGSSTQEESIEFRATYVDVAAGNVTKTLSSTVSLAASS